MLNKCDFSTMRQYRREAPRVSNKGLTGLHLGRHFAHRECAGPIMVIPILCLLTDYPNLHPKMFQSNFSMHLSPVLRVRRIKLGSWLCAFASYEYLLC